MIATTRGLEASMRQSKASDNIGDVLQQAHHACRYIPAKHMLTMSRSGPIQRFYDILKHEGLTDMMIARAGQVRCDLYLVHHSDGGAIVPKPTCTDMVAGSCLRRARYVYL